MRDFLCSLLDFAICLSSFFSFQSEGLNDLIEGALGGGISLPLFVLLHLYRFSVALAGIGVGI